MFIHGGGFCSGTPEMLLPQCRHFSMLGFLCISVEYNLMTIENNTITKDSIPIEKCISDCKDAVRYIKMNAKNKGIERIILVGESAGGYLACAIAADIDIDDKFKLSAIPDVLIAYNPITHLIGKWKNRIKKTEHEDRTNEWLSRHKMAVKLSPLYNITKNHPPTLIVHGIMDTVVPPEDSAEYCRTLEANGIDVS
jgi:acetyl esterase/lipase